MSRDSPTAAESEQEIASLIDVTTLADTLLVVESIGVHIESKRILGAFTSTEFLPWDTVEDIFISEVIKGVSRSLIGGERARRSAWLTRK